MVCAELDSVRLTRCKVSIDVDEPISESNQVSLALKVKADGKKTSESSLELTFDFMLTGDVGEGSNKGISITLRLNGAYRFPPDLVIEPFDIKAFAKSNGMLNVWPYWREFVQSITSRAGLPPLTVPLFRIHHKASQQKSN
jgi:preprotein translocase subunit SecB